MMSSFRKARDRYFYFSLALLAVVLFDISAPQDFGVILSEFLKNKLQVTHAPDMQYVRSLIWFLLLGVTVRYCQTALFIERLYKYIHSLEDHLSAEVSGSAFTREGKAYGEGYPLFSNWAHYLYTLVFPLLFILVIVVRTAHELRSQSATSVLTWFDLSIAIAMCVSIFLYLFAFHNWHRQNPNKSEAV